MPAPPSFSDVNDNGYPDSFEKEERTLAKQISTRRKQYMARFGDAEQAFGDGPNQFREEGYNDQSVVNDLFK